MKKLMLLALMMYAVSCTNPEDQATGNGDSSTFNNEGTNLNTASDFDKQSTETPDTSAAPAIDKNNANSKTEGTNRSYGTGADSSKNKQ